MRYGMTKLPLLLERVGVRRIKSSRYIPLIPTFSLWRRSSKTCVDTYALIERLSVKIVLL
jgi:hypothetical protein